MKDGKLSEAPDFTAVTSDSKSNWPRHFRSVNHRANLGDIPFNQPSKFELSINLKTAKALSLSVPAALLEALSDTCLTRSAQRPDFRRLMHGAKGGV